VIGPAIATALLYHLFEPVLVLTDIPTKVLNGHVGQIVRLIAGEQMTGDDGIMDSRPELIAPNPSDRRHCMSVKLDVLPNNLPVEESTYFPNIVGWGVNLSGQRVDIPLPVLLVSIFLTSRDEEGSSPVEEVDSGCLGVK
jgi:hypothetical protein